MRMLGKTAMMCAYGCCRATPPSGRARERRWIKRAERQQWRQSYE